MNKMDPKDKFNASFIITRPTGQEQELLSALSNSLSSTKILHQPLIEIQPVQINIPHEQSFDGAIFVSKNAVNHAKEFIESNHFNQLIAVGSGTAKALNSLTKQSVIHPSSMNAEGVLALDCLQNLTNEKWVICKGRGGRTLLQNELENRGAKTFILDFYVRKLPDFAEQQKIINLNSPYSVWIISSLDALSNLYRILGLSGVPNHVTKVIVSSDRIADDAMTKGFTVIGNSKGASTHELVEYMQSNWKMLSHKCE